MTLSSSNTPISTSLNTLIPTPLTLTDIPHFTSIIATSFSSIALTNAFILELDNSSDPLTITYERRRQHFANGIQEGFDGGAEMIEAGDWSIIASWETPTFKGKPFTHTGSSGPLRNEWRERITRIKPKTCYHLMFLARNTNVPRIQGSLAAVITPYLERAKSENTPVWLEAASEEAHNLYASFGFRLVEKITLGQNTHDSKGYPLEGGEGFSGWCMIY